MGRYPSYPGSSRRQTALLVLLAAALFLSGSQASEVSGAPAAKFELMDLNGRPVNLSSYRGRAVLLNFWATWCVPCLQEIPELIKLQKSVARPVTIIGIAVASGERNDIRDFVKQHGINYLVLLDPDKKVFQEYRLMGLPTSLLLDPVGRRVKTYMGPQSYEKLFKDVAMVLKNQEA